MIPTKKELEGLYKAKAMSYSDDVRFLTPSGKGGVVLSRDYQRALLLMSMVERVARKRRLGCEVFERFHSLSDVLTFVGRGYQIRYMFESLCLCYYWDALSVNNQSAMLRDVDWVCTRKHSGVRALLVATQDMGRQFQVFGRGYSDDGCGVLEYTDNLNVQLVGVGSNSLMALDCEICYDHSLDMVAPLGITEVSDGVGVVQALLGMSATDALGVQRGFERKYGFPMLDWYLIAPLYYKGKNYLARPLGAMLEVSSDVCGSVEGLRLLPLEVVAGSKEAKTAYINSVIDGGGEGVVFWNVNAHYKNSVNRDKDVWVKCKHKIGEKVLGDTFDVYLDSVVFINGRRRYLCNIRIEQSDGSVQERNIGAVSIPHDDSLYYMDEHGGVAISPDVVGRVVEVRADKFSKWTFRFDNLRYVRWRVDKLWRDCTYTEAYLQQIAE